MNPLLKLAALAGIGWLLVRAERERYARKCDDVAKDWRMCSAPGEQAAKDCARVIRRSFPWH